MTGSVPVVDDGWLVRLLLKQLPAVFVQNWSHVTLRFFEREYSSIRQRAARGEFNYNRLLASDVARRIMQASWD